MGLSRLLNMNNGQPAQAARSRGIPLSFLRRIFGETQQRAPLEPLYRAIVAAGRDPFWYRDGEVPDTVGGRFDMIASILGLVLIRLGAEGGETTAKTTYLTELFIDDMEGNVREIGIGDLMVGKQVGQMVSALGGRMNAFRAGSAEGGDLKAAVRRNIFHDAPPSDEAVATVADRLQRFQEALAAAPADVLLEGRLPSP